MNRKFVLGIMIFLLGAIFAWGQAGTLSGTITDPSGKPVPNSVITITNTATNASQKAVSGPDGSFRVSLPPGTYKVEFETSGFKHVTANSVEVSAGANAQLNSKLETGAPVEVVQLKGDATEAQDTPPEIERDYSQTPVQSLPIFDRNYGQLIDLMPGVTPPLTEYDSNFGITADPQRSRQFHTNGLPSYANDHTQDGDSVREPFTGDLSIQVAPNEGVRELLVTTSNYRADSGFGSGSIDNVFSRPGTNGLHGSLYGFHSDDFLQARNPISIGSYASPLHWWQAGAGVGGAIIPDRTFFFANYEGTLYHDGAVQLGTVPTASMLTGNFSGLGATIYNPFSGSPSGSFRTPLAGGIIPARMINPVSLAILSALPAPNLPGVTNNFVSTIPFTDNSNVLTARLDHRFSNNVTGFLDYGFSYFNANQSSFFGPAAGGSTSSALRNDHAAISLLGNRHGLIGELRFTYNRYRNAVTPTDLTSSLNPVLAANGFTSLPTINIAGLGTLGEAPNLPNKMIDNTYEGSANFQWVRGRHDVRFGTDIRALEANGFTNYPFGPNGTLFFGPGATLSAESAALAPVTATYFNSLAAFLTGAPVANGVFAYSTTPTYRQNQYAGFVLDTIRLTPRFTVELGVRYDVFSPVTTRFGAAALLYNPATGNAIYSNGSTQYDLDNWSPRVGIAFRPFEHTVVRGSYGIYHFPVPFLLSAINPAGAGVQNGLINGSFVPVSFAVPPVPAQAAGVTPGTVVPAPNIPLNVQSGIETPYTQNYYVMVQQDMTHGVLFDVSYVGNVGRQLPFTQALNVAAPGTGLNGLRFTGPVGVNEVGTGLTSNYNALQVNLSKRFSHGVGFTVAYTWSKALDYGATLLDPFSRPANYGPSDWDRTQMLTLSHTFDIPIGAGTHVLNEGVVGHALGGWRLNGMFNWGTGTPYSILAPPTGCNCPGLPAVFAMSTGAPINGQASFNPALFTAPASGTLGIASRNAYRGPDFTAYNLSLFKQFRVAEHANFEIRGEAFNLFNSPAFATPVANLGSPSFGNPSLLSTSLVNGLGPRTFLLGARFLF